MFSMLFHSAGDGIGANYNCQMTNIISHNQTFDYFCIVDTYSVHIDFTGNAVQADAHESAFKADRIGRALL